MARKRFGPEQIVTKLRQIEMLIGEGQSLQQTDLTSSFWAKLKVVFELERGVRREPA